MATANARGERLKYCTSALLVGLDDESVVLGHRRLDPVAPVAEFGGVVGNSLDGSTGCVAALMIRVVVAPAGTPNQPNTLADKEIDHLDARSEKHLAAGGRGDLTDVADDVVEVRQAVLVRIGDARVAHQRVVRQPDHTAGHPGRPADEVLLLDHEGFDPRVESCQRSDHSAAAASRDEQVDGLIPIHHARALSESPRSATGTSMVVFVF